MNIRLVISAVLFLCLVNIYGQEKDESPFYTPDSTHQSKKDKLDVNLTAGTTFVYSKAFGSGNATYVAPQLTYKFTPRFNILAGIMVIESNIATNRYLLMANEPSEVIKTKPTTSAIAYVSGNYILSDRLTISGMVMKDLSTNNYLQKKYGYSGFQAMSLNLNYKLTDHITLGAGMHISNQSYPGSSWGMGYQSSPFYSGF